MSKRVNITYSVNFDKIPETIKDLISKTYYAELKSLDEDFNKVITSLEKENEKETLQTIDDIRQKLTNIDFCLNDCYNIMTEYQKKLLTPDKENDSDG